MEWLAGISSLATIIEKNNYDGLAAVAFALLEGHPMYIDCFIVFMTLTPPICSTDQVQKLKTIFKPYNVMNTDLTPDQDSLAYIDVMKQAPLFILKEMIKYKIGIAVFAKIQQSQIWFLLVQRFLRIIAREGMQTSDGIELGPICREIFPYLCSNIISSSIKSYLQKGPMTDAAGQALIADTEEFKIDEKDDDNTFDVQLKKLFSNATQGATDDENEEEKVEK